MIKAVKNTVPWIYVISDIKGKEIAGMFYEKKLKKKKKKEFRIEKLIKNQLNQLKSNQLKRTHQKSSKSNKCLGPLDVFLIMQFEFCFHSLVFSSFGILLK